MSNRNNTQPLDQLYRQCQGELEGLLFKKTGCRDTAADLCQEAFSHVCQINDLGKISNLKGYLYRTAMNLLYDASRKKAVWRNTVIEWPDEQLPDGVNELNAEIFNISEQRVALILRALAELPPLCQRVFYLNRFEGIKQRVIAEQLNISVRCVESNIKRALVHCAKAIEKY